MSKYHHRNVEFYCEQNFVELMETLKATLVHNGFRNKVYSLDGATIKFGDRYYKNPVSTNLLPEFKLKINAHDEKSIDEFEKLILQEEEKFKIKKIKKKR